MTGEAIVAKLKNIQPIANADRIVQAELMGETVIISKDNVEGTIGILFDCETQLSAQYCFENNLYRDKSKNKDKTTVGYVEDNGRIRAIKLKGVKCSGLWMPLSSLSYIKGVKLEELTEGTQFKVIGAQEVCKKYTRVIKTTNNGNGRKDKKVKASLVPTFKEHVDSEQLLRNVAVLKNSQQMTVTVKLHGTSCRVGRLPIVQEPKWWQKLLKIVPKPIYGHVVGSRRVLKFAGQPVDGASFYDTDVWTASSKIFEGKLEKGETVFYEIVGYLPSEKPENSAPIMGSQSNEKLSKFMEKDEFKKFIQQYGDTTVFSYGCKQGEFKVFVYRMTIQNEDGFAIDYSWDKVKLRCEQMGIPTVPELIGTTTIFKDHSREDALYYDKTKGVTNIVDEVKKLAEDNCQFFPMNLREGVVVRIDGPKCEASFYKVKSYTFRVLEGIIKDNEKNVDIEEQQSEQS